MRISNKKDFMCLNMKCKSVLVRKGKLKFLLAKDFDTS